MSTSQKFIPALKYPWLTGSYDWVIGNFFPEKKFKTALLIQAGFRNKDRVLDFGCGTATLSIMAKKMNPQISVTGLDVDDNILAIANNKIKKSGENILTIKYVGARLPFDNHCFDRVITSLVLHHLTPAQKINTLKELSRVLKPGGELHVADWGKAQNMLMRLLFLIVQFLDGFETTTDSVNGKLTEYITETGFENMNVTKNYSTVLGTLSLYKAVKVKEG